MQIKISSREEKPLLSRTEISGEVAYEAATPSRAGLKKELAAALKANPEFVVIKEIAPVFGIRKSFIKAHIYKSVEDIKMYESQVIIKRNAKAPKSSEKKAEGA